MFKSVPRSEIARTESEAHFHDARADSAKPARLGYVYASVADVYRFTDVPLLLRAGTVLELGCFQGVKARKLSVAFTGRYLGTDISSAAVERCRSLGLGGRFRFEVDDANRLQCVEDASIDYAFGDGVLHHLELERFCTSLSRVLKPEGIARFAEPAQGNWLLRAFRMLTPRLRTPDERPFDPAALATLKRHFDVRMEYHALLRPLVPMLLRNHPAVVLWTRKADRFLLRWPALQGLAWMLTIELHKIVG